MLREKNTADSFDVARLRRPTAIFAANDVMATAVIDTARNLAGLCLPRDLSVIGFDNTPLGATLGYALTSVDQNIEMMAAQAIDILRARVENPAMATVKRLLPARLEMRASVGPPA